MHQDPQKHGEGQAIDAPFRSEMASKAAIFGTAGAQGFLPKALTLMSGQPCQAELQEAEELLSLAVEEVKRWRGAIGTSREVPR